MAAPLRLSRPSVFCTRVLFSCKRLCYSYEEITQGDELVEEKKTDIATKDDGKFRKFNIPGKKPRQIIRNFEKRNFDLDSKFLFRWEKQKHDQDWNSVWPAAKTFQPTAVPLPLRQGFIRVESENDGITPDKYRNMELIKLPNFLHLSPPAVWKQCQYLKKLCTPWPSLSDEQIDKLLPLHVIESDYCLASSTIRDPRARKVEIKFSLDQLRLDAEAKEKFIHIVGDRYTASTGIVSFVSDRCPTKQQNRDYLMYLLTAVYFEAKTTEPWESVKEADDYLEYDFDRSESKQPFTDLIARIGNSSKESVFSGLEKEEICNNSLITSHREVKNRLFNSVDKKEREKATQDYKQISLSILTAKASPTPKSPDHHQAESSV